MTAAQWVGALMLLAVFAGIFATTARMEGWRAAAVIWAGTIAVAAVVVVAAYLLTGELS